MSRHPKPFTFDLTDAEAQQITGFHINGTGGLQTLLRRLKAELTHGRRIVMDDAQLGQLLRYTTRYGSGGFEDRLRKAFFRSLQQLFGKMFPFHLTP